MNAVFVSNASPLIAFERLQHLDTLHTLLGHLIIPPAVRREVFADKAPPAWISERPITQPLSALALSARLGPGEREAIALALEIGDCTLLLDDLAARRAAQTLHIRMVGTVGLLLLAKERKLLDQIRPHMDTLRALDFRISDPLYKQALTHANEP